MKLLTASGLLFAATTAQTVDGHKGSFTEIDWVATFAEGVSVAASAPNVGWNPMVHGVLAACDGGKVLAGWGHTNSMIIMAWVIKMWGDKGTFACADNAVITGYVTMVVTTAATTTALCLTNVQWRYASDETVEKSAMFLDVAEDWKYGATGAACIQPYYLMSGGIHEYASYGMGNYWVYIVSLTYAGGTASTNKVSEALHKNGDGTAVSTNKGS